MNAMQLRGRGRKFNAKGANHICMGIFKKYSSNTSPLMLRSYGGAGAVWDIWPRECRPAIERFLVHHAKEFRAECASGDDGEDEDAKMGENDILHPIHDQVSIGWWLQIAWLSQGMDVLRSWTTLLCMLEGSQGQTWAPCCISGNCPRRCNLVRV